MNNPSPLKRTAPPIPREGGNPIRAFLSTGEGLGFVRVVVRKFSRSPIEHDEMVSAALLKCLEGADRYDDRDGAGSVLGWVSVVSVRAALSVRRNEGRRSVTFVSGESAGEGRAGAIERAADAGVEGADVLLRDRVRAVLARLEGDMLRAWWGVDILGKTCEEVASELGCALGTVMSRASRIRARLAAEFEAL